MGFSIHFGSGGHHHHHNGVGVEASSVGSRSNIIAGVICLVVGVILAFFLLYKNNGCEIVKLRGC